MQTRKERRLAQAMTERKGHYKLVKKGRHWLARGLFVAVMLGGEMAISQGKVFADDWQANTPNQVGTRLHQGDKQFTFTKGDTFWAVGQVLNIKYQTLMEWNGYREGDQYTIPVGTVITVDGNHVTVTDAQGQVVADKVVQPEQKQDPNQTVMNQASDTPTKPVVADSQGNVVSSAPKASGQTQTGQADTKPAEKPSTIPATPEKQPEIGGNGTNTNPMVKPGENSGNETTKPETKPEENTGGETTKPETKPEENTGGETMEPANPGEGEGTGTTEPTTPEENIGGETTNPETKPEENTGSETTEPANPGEGEGTGTTEPTTPGENTGGETTNPETKPEENTGGETTEPANPGEGEGTGTTEPTTPGENTGNETTNPETKPEEGTGDDNGETTEPNKEEDLQPTAPAMPTVDTSALQMAVMNSMNVQSQSSYINAAQAKKEAYQTALNEARQALTNPNLTAEDVQNLTHKLNTAQESLDGKPTDLKAAEALIKEADTVQKDVKYRNATQDKRQAYEQAMAKLQQALQMGANNLTQGDVDQMIAQVKAAENALDGQPLSPEAQAKADAIRNFQDTYEYYKTAVAMLPADDQCVSVARYYLDNFGTANIDKLDQQPTDYINNNIKMLKYIDFYIKPVQAQMAGRQALEEQVKNLEDLIANKITITNEVTRLQDFVKKAKEMLADPSKAFEYQDKADQLKRAGEEALEAQNKAVQELNEYNEKRAAALKQLMEEQVKGKDTYVQLVSDDKKQYVSPANLIVNRAKLMEQTLPFQGNQLTGSVLNPEYLQYKTVDEYLQVGTPAYDKMTATVNRLADQILEEYKMGRGTKVALLNDPSLLVRTLPSDADVAALKPLIDLADAVTARSLENINRMRFAVGLYPLQKAPLSDKRKAMAIVHAIAGYVAGQIANSKDNTTGIKSSHVGTIAALLAPHAMTAGWNENVYPSTNEPLKSTHMTAEYLADVDTRIVLEEGIRFYEAVRNHTEDPSSAGHFENMLDYSLGYYYSSPIVREINKEANGYESYRFSITELFYAQATEEYKEMLRHYNEWPQINPETDLDKTDFSDLKSPDKH